jgi:hypothetical protein
VSNSFNTTLQAQRSTKEVMTMINRHSDTWGSQVHCACDGSWVTDKHGDEDEHEEK